MNDRQPIFPVGVTSKVDLCDLQHLDPCRHPAESLASQLWSRVSFYFQNPKELTRDETNVRTDICTTVEAEDEDDEPQEITCAQYYRVIEESLLVFAVPGCWFYLLFFAGYLLSSNHPSTIW